MQNSAYHFSLKILLLSALFLLVNAVYIGVKVSGQNSLEARQVAPIVTFESGEEVLVKTAYGEDFAEVPSSSTVLIGSTIKTTEESLAEIRLEDTVVRLDENTEVVLKNNVYTGRVQKEPRLTFELLQGSLWVNADERVDVLTERSMVSFEHSIGSYTYASTLSRVMAVQGSADIALYTPEKEVLTGIVLPFRHQVTYTDSQLLPEYAVIEYSKLKKELKLARVSESVLSDPWVERNTENDEHLFVSHLDYIFSASTFNIRDRIASVRDKLTLIPKMHRELKLSRIDLRLRYLLGGVHENRDMNLAKTMLDEIKTLSSGLKGDSKLSKLYTEQFYSIFNVDQGTPAYLAKEFLRNEILGLDNSDLLRSYMADIDFHLNARQLDKALLIAEVWLNQWSDNRLAVALAEYENQARLLEGLMLGYADRIDTSLLALYDQSTQVLLGEHEGDQEVYLAVTQARLNMAKFLLSEYRYLDAKQYLRTAYQSLDIENLKGSLAAKQIFLEEGKLIAQRIEFAEDSLRGAALPIDESEFRTFINTKNRDDILSSSLSEFLAGENDEDQIEEITGPDVSEVAQRFLESRIAVISRNIKVSQDNEFEFKVTNARLIDRGVDGSSIAFDATYDYITNGINEVIVNNEPFAGSYTLPDFVRIVRQSGVIAQEEEVSNIDFLLGDKNDEIVRAQAVAQDLAAQLLIKELETHGILVPGTQVIDVLDPATLIRFRVKEAQIADSTGEEKRIVAFDYNLNTKMVSKIVIDEASVIEGQYHVSEFVNNVFGAIQLNRLRAAGFGAVVSTLEEQFITALESDLSYVNEGVDLVEIKKANFTPLALEFSGVYDRKADRFVEITHELLSQDSVSSEAFFSALAPLYLESFLEGHGIVIPLEDITLDYPFDTILVEDLQIGIKHYTFVIDVLGNRLLNVAIKGTNASAPVMNFEEFKSITGIDNAPVVESEVESEPEVQEEPKAEENKEVLDEGIDIEVPVN